MAATPTRPRSEALYWKYEQICRCIQRRWHPARSIGRRGYHRCTSSCSVSPSQQLGSWRDCLRKTVFVDVKITYIAFCTIYWSNFAQLRLWAKVRHVHQLCYCESIVRAEHGKKVG